MGTPALIQSMVPQATFTSAVNPNTLVKRTVACALRLSLAHMTQVGPLRVLQTVQAPKTHSVRQPIQACVTALGT